MAGQRPAHNRPKPPRAEPDTAPPAAPAGSDLAQEIAEAEIVDLTGEIGEAEPSTVLDSPESSGTALRAGGHIDRGDGRGWVVEQDEE